MIYSEKIADHFENPRRVGSLPKDDPDVGSGVAGTGAEGGVIRIHVRVDDKGVIIDARFKAFGCPAAIASGSLAAEWLMGKTVREALAIDGQWIADQLQLTDSKRHCSEIATRAVREAASEATRGRVGLDGMDEVDRVDGVDENGHPNY